VAEGKELKKLGPTQDDLYGLDRSPDGKLLATSGYAGFLSVWDVAEGKQLSSRKLPKYGAYCVKFSPDGKQLITGHDNGMCYVSPVH
jgi:WD40 repeat protein